MRKLIAIVVMLAGAATAQAPLGKWTDVTKDESGTIFFGSSESTKLLIAEDYEVLQTHEVCASVTGYFMEKSQQGRYNVNFKGMRTTATFTFSTQYDAEQWVKKFCTPESLTSIKQGRAALARNY